MSLVRAAQLFLLGLWPQALSPDPAPAVLPATASLLVLIGLALSAAACVRLHARLRSRASLAAGLLLAVAVVAALVGAARFSGERGPLLRGALYVAAPLWAALATVAGALASRWRRARLAGARPRGARRASLVAAVLVLAAGGALHADAARLYRSREAMWWEAFRRDGSDARPLAALAGPLVGARRFAEAARVTDRCALVHPTSCVCPMWRARIELSTRELDAARADAAAAVAACPESPAAHAALAEALAQRGALADAEREVQRGLDLSQALAAAPVEEARLHHARALLLERQQRYPEARAEAARAIAGGAGRDARLLAAALALVTGDLDEAARLLGPLAADPADADAQYDLALLADRRGDYNRARQGYLAVLKLDPRYASARYNLTALAWRAGVTDEARHHAHKFRESFPDDPRSAQLAQLVGL